MLWVFENITEPGTWCAGGVYGVDDAERMAALAAVTIGPNGEKCDFEVLVFPHTREAVLATIELCNFEDNFWEQRINVKGRALFLSYDMLNPLFIDQQYFPSDKLEEANPSGLLNFLDAHGLLI